MNKETYYLKSNEIKKFSITFYKIHESLILLLTSLAILREELKDIERDRDGNFKE